MVDVASYVRIFAATPDDDLVEKRTAAVRDLAAKIAKDSQPSSLLQAANDVALAVDAKAPMPEGLAEDVQASVRKTAKAFVAAEAELEVTVCALMAALEVIEGAKSGGLVLTRQEFFALGLWSALGFQPPRSEPKLEELRGTVLRAAQALVLRSAHTSRERHKVMEVKATAPDPVDGATIAAAIGAATNAAVAALRANAQLDREEIDLLWWVVGDWSELLQRPFADATNKAAAALAAGLEAGAIIRRVPSSAHRHLVLRQAAASDEEVTLPELLKRLGDDRDKLAASFADEAFVGDFPAVFPLLHAVRTGKVTDAKSRLKRSHGEWAERALLERATLRVISVLSQSGK
jgi:hypothetical protein